MSDELRVQKQVITTAQNPVIPPEDENSQGDKQVKVSADAGMAQGVIWQNDGKPFTTNGTTGSIMADYNGTYARAQANLGSAVGAGAEIGHEFTFGGNFGADLSVGGKFTQSLVNKADFDAKVFSQAGLIYKNDKGLKITIGGEFGVDKIYQQKTVMSDVVMPQQQGIRGSEVSEISELANGTHAGNANNGTTGYSGAIAPDNGAIAPANSNKMQTYLSSGVDMSTGLQGECGVLDLGSVAEEVSVDPVQATKVTAKQKVQTYFTPRVKVEQKLGNSNFSIQVDASAKEVTGGIKYTF